MPTTTYDTPSDLTAVISILKERSDFHRHPDPSQTDDVHYTILLWLVGKVLMPPYLPRFSARVSAAKRRNMLRDLKDLAARYERYYADYELDGDEAKEILEEVMSVGAKIGTYIPHLYGCLEALPKLGVRNVIIHTDEPTIPWHLAVSDFVGALDFLCNQYSCGTILTEEAGWVENEGAAMPRFISYSKLREQPDLEDLNKKEFCLIAGEIGQRTPAGQDLGTAYVENLKVRLEASHFCSMPIQCVSAMDWAKSGKDPIDQLRQIFRRAQIVHFTGHFIDGKMKLTNDVLIGSADLAGLQALNSKPLVVLHGCASAGVAGGEVAQVLRAFLNKGAGGCLATVLPVNIPALLADGADTVVELFYENLFKAPSKSYGTALREARRLLRAKFDPQHLFYHFFGDPRETLISTRKKTVTDYIAREQMEEKSRKASLNSELRLRFSGEGIDESTLVKALRGMTGVEDVKLHRSAVQLCEPCICTIVVTLVGMGLAKAHEKKIGTWLKDMFPGLTKVETVEPSDVLEAIQAIDHPTRKGH